MRPVKTLLTLGNLSSCACHCLLLVMLYTVSHKKRDILFLTITLANLNRFSQFLYHFNHE